MALPVRAEPDNRRAGSKAVAAAMASPVIGGMALLLPLRHAGGGEQRKLGALGW